LQTIDNKKQKEEDMEEIRIEMPEARKATIIP